MKHKVFRRYKVRKRGGQHYWIRRKSYANSPFMTDIRKKKIEEAKLYSEALSKIPEGYEDKKAHEALRIAADINRAHPLNKEEVVSKLREVFKTHPIAEVAQVTDVKDNEIGAKKVGKLFLKDKDADFVSNELADTMDAHFIRADAKEALARDLYGKEYIHQLDKKQKSHLNYLINKHSKAR